MALQRFVVTAPVTVAAGTPTGGAYGSATTPGTAWSELWPVTFIPGQVVWADSTALGTSAPCLLYQAIGAGNLRPWVDGQDTVGHAALSN
jgi:hypothetical protein